jgi:hypothetical protein
LACRRKIPKHQSLSNENGRYCSLRCIRLDDKDIALNQALLHHE